MSDLLSVRAQPKTIAIVDAGNKLLVFKKRETEPIEQTEE